jgi:membrane fusion protein (multidrug efflux system)
METHVRISKLIVIFAATALVGCTEEIESDPEMTLARGDLISLASAATTGETAMLFNTYLYSERDIDIFSRLGSGEFFEQGVIVSIVHVEVGDRVTAGQLLATMEDDEAAIELEAAQAAADEAIANFGRVEELREREVVAPSEYDEALYNKRFTEAELKRAKLNLSRTRVRAPFTGVVSRRYIRQGELIETTSPLFRITAMNPLRARLLVAESRSAAFRTGASVTVTGVDGSSATARVLVVGPTVDPGSGTREVIIELIEPDGFRPGASVIVSPIPTAEVETR